MNWYVLHTRPRNEKKVSERLTQQGFTAYLPMQKMLRQWSDRKKMVSEPLYKSYVFLYCSEIERQEAIKTPGIVRCLYYLGAPAKVRDEEIKAIQQFLGKIEDYPEATLNHFSAGDLVAVKSGALKGVKGTYISRNGNDLFLWIESLGSIVQAKIPARYILN